jgi:hypothetical protein
MKGVTSYEDIPLHLHGKEWVRVYVSPEGAICLEPVSRTPIGTTQRGDYMPLHPDKAEELIKALKRALRRSKRGN